MSDVPLREHFEALRKADQRAIDAALVASEKRLDALNELRQGVATSDQLDALEKIVANQSRIIYIGLGIVLSVQFIIGVVVAFY